MRKKSSSPLRSEVLPEIRRRAKGQGGAISIDQLEELGVSARTAQRWTEDGTLTGVARGVFSPDTTIQQLGRWWAAHLSVGPNSVIAEQSAVSLWDLVRQPGSPVHMFVRGAPPRPQPGIVVYERRTLRDDEFVTLDGLPRSTVARTIFDRAAKESFDGVRRLLDRAIQLRLFDLAALDAQVARSPKSERGQGLDAALKALHKTAGDNRADSERRLADLINDSHLPDVAVNFVIAGWETDFHFIGTRAIVELDSRSFHSTPDQIAADIAKQRALEAMGFKFLRLTWAEITYGTDRTLARIERFLAANMAPPVPGPPPELILSAR